MTVEQRATPWRSRLRAAPGWPVGPDHARWGLMAVVGCFLAAQVFSIVWFVLAASAIYGSDPLPTETARPVWISIVLVAGLWIGYVAGPIVINRATDSGPMKDFDLRASPTEALLGLVAGVAVPLAVLPPLYWVVVRVLPGDPNERAEALGDTVNNGADVVLFVLLLVVGAPLVEEWFYRGMVLPTMTRSFGNVGGVVGSAVVFALVHREVILLPGLFVFGLVLALLTVKTGRIGPAVIAHMAFNATTVVNLLAF